MTAKTDPAANPYEDKRNIQVGKGRIIWCAYAFRPGWALPGGGMTQDVEVAIYAAKMIDELSK